MIYLRPKICLARKVCREKYLADGRKCLLASDVDLVYNVYRQGGGRVAYRA